MKVSFLLRMGRKRQAEDPGEGEVFAFNKGCIHYHVDEVVMLSSGKGEVRKRMRVHAWADASSDSPCCTSIPSQPAFIGIIRGASKRRKRKKGQRAAPDEVFPCQWFYRPDGESCA